MRTRTATATLLLALVLACGSQGSSKDGSKKGSDGSGSATNVGGSDGDGDGDQAPPPPAPPGEPKIVFNEVLAVGSSEWIEIVNPGTEAIDVSDYMIAGSDKDTGEAKTKSAMKFPAGTKIDPGGRVLILTSRAKEEPVGPHGREQCLADGPDTCFYASFGVSATTGEALHFLTPDGSLILSTAVPASASADAGGLTTASQCRLPDTTGEFSTCSLTPGQPNRAP